MHSPKNLTSNQDNSFENTSRNKNTNDVIVDSNKPELIANDSEVPKPQLKRRSSFQAHAEKINTSPTEDFAGISTSELWKIALLIDDAYVEEIRQQDKQEFQFKDILEYAESGMSVIVEDDFSLCFRRPEHRSWNFNSYLMVLWVFGVVIRYGILFPLRLIVGIATLLATLIQFWLWKQLFSHRPKVKEQWELWSLQLLTRLLLFSWTSVVQYHGVITTKRKNQIYVANHTTMLDWVLLMQAYPFCTVGQLHASHPFISWIQLDLLKALNCIWFDRNAQKDREMATNRIKEHISDSTKPRLLIFPEGTCVNNEYIIQFKKGTFEMEETEICPIGIKYNSNFVDAYWISRERPFHWHLFDIMTSWAMVADIYWLEPQKKRLNENGEQFAARVKAQIAEKTGLIDVDWNGYLKHYKPSDRIIEEQKKVFCDRLDRLYKNCVKNKHDNININSNDLMDDRSEHKTQSSIIHNTPINSL